MSINTVEYGDYIEDTATTADELAANFDLIKQQAIDTFPLLKDLNKAKPYKLGWYIKQTSGVMQIWERNENKGSQ